jgi:hypothetical protein
MNVKLAALDAAASAKQDEERIKGIAAKIAAKERGIVEEVLTPQQQEAKEKKRQAEVEAPRYYSITTQLLLIYY